ncbi:transcription factor bHLH36-like [Olea europaea subsp. europaea]|uniref:Transcription factor bHLH36-like n=1 Tax=Olea europaea subsp. europaea TaxID=158383 RepID=A0A8S0ST90_OLEEU|nr:transcription factor bHLH36-like [Olea europaea subsp. europaea]
MFPTQQSNELVFPDPSIFEDDKVLEELLADHVLLGGRATNSTTKDRKKRRRESSASVKENKDVNDNEIKTKKVVHREIEKQRRQEMKKLCASLRSLLPLEFIKGKRSASDHMHEAANYIKHMQTGIEELSSRRDKLKNSSNFSAVEAMNASSRIGSTHGIVVNPFRDGVEILISSSLKPEGFPLSGVLQELLKMGLNAVSCETTKGNEKSIYRIQIEVTN